MGSEGEAARPLTAPDDGVIRMRLRRGLPPSQSVPCPPQRPSYADVCRRATHRLIRAGAPQHEIRLAYSQELASRGLEDRHAARQVLQATREVRGTRSIEDFFPCEGSQLMPQPSLSQSLSFPFTDDDTRKVIGWLVPRRLVTSNGGVSIIRQELTALGVDDSQWERVQWRDCQGASRGCSRLEIICSSRDAARGSLHDLRQKAARALGMEFCLGRSFEVRELDRRFHSLDVSQSSQRRRSPLPSPALPHLSPAPSSPFSNNYFSPLNPDASMEDSVSQGRTPHSRELLTVFWNANGLRYKVDARLMSLLEEVDVFGVAETLCSEVNLVRLDGFHHHGIHAGKSILNGTAASRGISLYWRTNLQVKANSIAHEEQDADAVWVRMQPRGCAPIFVGVFYAPQADDPRRIAAYAALSAQVDHFLNQGSIILMGDFNARTGLVERNQDPAVNANGPLLRDLVHNHRLEFLDLPQGTVPFTRIQRTAGQAISKSVIDYIIVSKDLAERPNTSREESAVECGSDHCFVCARIDIPVVACRRSEDVFTERICYEALRDGVPHEDGTPATLEELETLRNSFAAGIRAELADWQARWISVLQSGEVPSQVQVDQAAKEFSAGMERVATEVLGKTVTCSRRAHGWWTKELTAASLERQRLYKELKSSSSPSNALWQEYLISRRKVKKLARAAKTKSWQKKMDAIYKAKKRHSSKHMWNLIKSVSKRAPMGSDPLFVRDDDGNITASVEEALEAWRTHFERVANPADSEHFDANHRDQIEDEEQRIAALEPSDLMIELSVEDIMNALDTISVGSAPGPDGIGNLALKYGGGHRRKPTDPDVAEDIIRADYERKEAFAALLQTLFQLCSLSRRIPSAWKVADQVPIPKRSAEEDPACRGNFRGITLQSCTGKLYCRSLVDTYLSDIYEQQMHHEQGGFRQQRMCAHQHFLLSDTIHRALADDQTLYAVFIDIRKAYPSVWISGLFYKLRRVNPHINDQLIAILKDCITGGQTRILLRGKRSQPYSSSVGVREGCVESPILFNFFINDLIDVLRADGCQGVRYAASLLAALFADDIVLLSDEKEDMQRALNTLHRFCSLWRLQVNMSKTKLMIVGNPTDYDPNAPLRIGNEALERVNRYLYLGLWFMDDGTWDFEFAERMKKVRDAEARLQHFFAEKRVPMRVRWLAWCALIRSRIEYGCEVCIFCPNQMKELEDFQLQAARRIIGCNRKTSKDAIYGELQIQTFKVRFDKYRVRLLHDVAVRNEFLPLHHEVWNLPSSNRFPEHSFRRAMRALNQLSFGGLLLHNAEFLGPEGWKWARQTIMDHMVSDWKFSIEDKADLARRRGSVAQMERYQILKPRWGNVPYTALPDTNYGRLLFKIRSGTLPLLAFEGKEGSDTCVFCNRNERETINHFLYECDGSAAGSTIGASRHDMLRRLRECVQSSRYIMRSYGEQAITDASIWRLAVGCPIEEVYMEAFKWVPIEDNPSSSALILNEELVSELDKASRMHANRLNGNIATISMNFLCRAWQERCAFVEQTFQGPRNTVVARPLRWVTGRGVGRRDGERGRQRDIRDFFTNPQGTSSNDRQFRGTGAAMSTISPPL